MEDLSDILDSPATKPEPEVTFHPEPEGGWHTGDVVKSSTKGRWCFNGYHPDGSIKFMFKVTPHFGTPEGRKDINLVGPRPSEKPIWITVRDKMPLGDLVDFFVRVARGQEQMAGFKERMQAAQWLSDRGWGKAKETIVIEDPDGNPVKSPAVNVLINVDAEIADAVRKLHRVEGAGGDSPRLEEAGRAVEGNTPALPPRSDPPSA